MKLLAAFRFTTAITAIGLLASAATAANVDVASLLTNTGFEAGNISNWSLTLPNADYVSTLSPAVNPSIDPADGANNPATLVAPAGSFFTGLKRVGDVGSDLKYKLAHNAVAVSVPTGTVFQVHVWANRGRLEPFDTPASTADVLVRVCGWTSGTTVPTVNSSDNWSRTVNWNPAAQSFDFTSVADGSWGFRTFSFDPAALSINAATIKYLSVTIAGRTNNHDQYIALDIGQSAVSVQPSSWTGIKGLFR
jgi:hypothetical protein